MSYINSIQKLNNIVVFCFTHPRPGVISNKWRYDTSQNWEYLAKNVDNLTTILISNEILLRLVVYISSIGYLENGTPCFIEVTEYDNISFDSKVVEDEDGKKELGKKAVIDSEEKASKKKA